MSLRELVKGGLNGLLRGVGARMVNAEWGPKGFAACFERARAVGFEPRTIVDAGASDGRWTLECAEVFPQARYALFDPLPENVAAIAHLTDGPLDIVSWQGALGAEPGALALNAHGHQSSFYNSAEFPGEPLKVAVRTLDSFIEPMGFTSPMLIKADVQGYELNVLRGGAKCLEMTEMILLEVSFRQVYSDSPLAHEVIAALAAKGYRIYDICSYAQRASDRELAQADIAFVRAGSKIFRSELWA